MGTEKLIHYNPFRSINKYLKSYLEGFLQKQIIFATPQKAYAHLVEAISDKTKKFADWPVFSVSMLDKRIDKEQLNPVLYRLDGGISGERITDGTDTVYINWIPMTFSYQIDIWADTRNRLESYVNILIMRLSNYPAFKVYYQEKITGAYSIATIDAQSISDTSNLDPGEELVEFRHTFTIDLKTQLPIKANIFGRIEEIIENFYLMDDGVMDSTAWFTINITS